MIKTNGAVGAPCNHAKTVRPFAVDQSEQQTARPALTPQHPHDGLPSYQRQKQASRPSAVSDAPYSRRVTATTQTALPRMLSPADVAALLQVSTRTVRRWIEASELRVHRLGRQLRVSEDDLSAFVKSKRS